MCNVSGTHKAEAHGFDPADSVSLADVAALLDNRWRVEVDEQRARHIDGGGAPHPRPGAARHTPRLGVMLRQVYNLLTGRPSMAA